jgi:hypothetical protein
VFVLEWPETHFLHGATVKVRSCSLGLSMQVSAVMQWDDLLAGLAAHIVEWDLERDGQPIAIEPEAMKAGIDRPVLAAIARAWVDASTGVTAPLDTASNDGPESRDTDELEQSLQMVSQ